MLMEANGIRVRVEMDGPADGTPVMFLHALGTRCEVWKHQVAALKKQYRIIRMDLRGHGESAAPEAAYSLPLLAGDVAQVITQLSLPRVVLVGLSIGGMVAQTLALARPDLVRALVLTATTSGFSDEARRNWDARIATLGVEGVMSQVAPSLERWFTPAYRVARPDVMAEIAGMIRATRTEGMLGCCHAIKELDLTDRLSEITAPTLVVSGEKDPGTPPEMGRIIAENIPAAQFELLPDAAHLLNVQQSDRYNAVLSAFLDGL